MGGNFWEQLVTKRIGRRRLLQSGATFSLSATALAVLGCSSGDDGDEAAPTNTAAPTSAVGGATATRASEVAAVQATSPAGTLTVGEVSPYAASYTIEDHSTGTEVSVTVENGTRHIVANGLPNHETGEFPNRGNPNTISEQAYDYTFPAEPVLAAEPVPYNVPQPYGMAVNGVHIDPYAAGWYNDDTSSGWQLAALAAHLGFDDENAHVQSTGVYHYHAAPMALLTRTDQPELIGFAGDGFPIYGPYGYSDPSDVTSEVVELRSSYQLKSGERPDGPGGVYDGTYVQDYEYVAGLGDLDIANGRSGPTPEYPEGTYYYVATSAWPYFGRYFAGAIADSFRKSLPQGVEPRAGGRGAGPQ